MPFAPAGSNRSRPNSPHPCPSPARGRGVSTHQSRNSRGTQRRYTSIPSSSTSDCVTTTTAAIDQHAIEQFLYREARHLDDREFEKWLDCYADDCEFWMPAWDDADQLTEDPQREISLIWYGNRGGLEDRVFRIRTERSSATIPDTRTSHNISNLELIEQGEGFCKLRFNWHTMSFRYKTVDHFYGTSFYTLDTRGESPLIKHKKVVLKNDYIRQVIDVYHV